MAVAAAIGVGGLDEGEEAASSNIMDDHRLSKHLRNKPSDPRSSMNKRTIDTSLKSSDISALPKGGILGEINRSIEKMSLTIEDTTSGQPCQSSKPTANLHNEHSMQAKANESSLTTLSFAENLSTNNYNVTDVNRRGSNWTTVSTEGYGSMCSSDQISTVASRRPSDISVSSFSQVLIMSWY